MSIDLAYLRETQGRYHFGPLDYAVNEVLNDEIERGLRFNFRGQMVEGVFIAWGFAPVPKKYRREALVPVRVVLMDSLKQEVTRDLLLPGCAAKRNQTKVRLRHAPDLSDMRDTTDPPGASSENLEVTSSTNALEPISGLDIVRLRQKWSTESSSR